MTAYERPVPCGTPGCRGPAAYKVAAIWVGGRFSELKTYGLACEAHSAEAFRDAVQRRTVHPPSGEERQGEIGLYRFVQGKSGHELQRVANPA